MDRCFRPKRLRKRCWKMSAHPFRWATVPCQWWKKGKCGEMKMFEVPNWKKNMSPPKTGHRNGNKKIKNPLNSLPKLKTLSVEGCYTANFYPPILRGEVCVSVWIMKGQTLSPLRRSSHGKSWRCGYGPRRLRHGGGQGWRYQGCEGKGRMTKDTKVRLDDVGSW